MIQEHSRRGSILRVAVQPAETFGSGLGYKPALHPAYQECD